MANIPAPITAPTPAATELEALLALVRRLAVASSEATSLATEVQGVVAKLPLLFPPPAAIPTSTWVRATAMTPAEVERRFPEGSGETWYIVIRGREPGLYRTSDEANAQTNNVPHQFRQKKTSRREAIAFYRENYVAALSAIHNPPATGTTDVGVQKWVEVPVV
ncbi:hypothetical protein B0H10DRAFT_2208938 [Mycena sp. CBHHK59/15]|nr:hypothetical protein B0H10DRAFT_2208938 [Mycena sp. CBHHK59/15]